MLSQVLKKLRKEKGITQKQLAEKLFVDQTAVSYWEQGKTNPDLEKQIALADFFNVTTDYLLGRTDDTGPQPLIIPEELKDVKVAFHNGEEDLTQDEVDKIAEYVRFLKSQRKKEGE